LEINRNLNSKAYKKPNVYIRADGSPEKGLGHLVRCIALSHMLQNDFDITFVCLQIPEKIKRELEESQFALMEIEESIFLELIKPKDIVVLDGYHFDTNYQKKIKATGVKLVCIDDLHDKEFVADLIINHAPGVKPEDYKAQPYTQFALGLGYALLRPVFLGQAKKVRKVEKIETVLVCFGGSDYKNLTEQALIYVQKIKQFKKIIIVTGSAYKSFSSLKTLIDSDKRIHHFHAIDEKKMLLLMEETDLAFVPSSSILLEVIASGCLAMFGYYTKNQIDMAQGINGMESGHVYLGNLENFNYFPFESLIKTNQNQFNERIIEQIKSSGENNLKKIKKLVYE
jgi:UDP-2,4-diacetamido-2,4,6-trideoxy-beta-L-altropyranose hydrolase